MISEDATLGSQLVEVDFHVVLEKPGLLETAAADLTAVLERVLVLPHVALQEPGLAEGLAAHLTGEFADGLPLIGVSRRRFLARTRIGSDVRYFHVADEILLVCGGELAQRAFVRFVQDPDVALELLMLPELPLAERAAEAGGLGLDELIWDRGHRGRGGRVRL